MILSMHLWQSIQDGNFPMFDKEMHTEESIKSNMSAIFDRDVEGNYDQEDLLRYMDCLLMIEDAGRLNATVRTQKELHQDILNKHPEDDIPMHLQDNIDFMDGKQDGDFDRYMTQDDAVEEVIGLHSNSLILSITDAGDTVFDSVSDGEEYDYCVTPM